MGQRINKTATILATASLSDAVLMKVVDDTLVGIVMPAAWTAASMTFQASEDGGTTYNNVFDTLGNEVTATVAASRFIAIDPKDFAGATALKVRSGTSGAPVTQAADRAIILVLRRVA